MATSDEDDLASLFSMLSALDDEPVASVAPVAPAVPAVPVATVAPAVPVTAAPPAGPGEADVALPPSVPATEGWHSDPGVPGQLRWFDGVRWTASVRPSVMAVSSFADPGPAPVGLQPASYQAPPPTELPPQPPFPRQPGPIIRTGDDFVFGHAAPARSWRLPVLGDLDRKTIVRVAVVLAVLVVAAYSTVIRDGGPHYPSRWDARVADIAHFVESERGSTFEHPVAVEFLSVPDFKKHVGGEADALSAEDRKSLDDTAAAMRALGLLSGPVDLHSLEKKLTEESIIGLYDPMAKKVWVRGSQLTPDVRVTLAHELTHALQDQRFGLLHLQRDPNSQSAVRALIEADARRVEEVYRGQMSEADQKLYDAAQKTVQSESDTSGIPDVLTHSLAFPYVFGPTFEQALIAEGGLPAVDRAFRSPPHSEAEILDPGLFLKGFRVSTPPAPPVEKGRHPVVRPSPFGQESMVEVLAGQVGFDGAWKAVQGWRGDVVSIDGPKAAKAGKAGKPGSAGDICVAVNTRFDTDEHAAAFKQAASTWATAAHGTVVGRGRTVGMRACDPGPSAAALPKADPDPFAVLSVRAAIMQGMLGTDGATLDLVTCTVDTLLGQLGAKAFAGLNEIAEGDPRIEQVKQQAGSAAAACRQAPHA
ncbi:MAG: hypothetical protein QOK43_1074 [Acidimicrobiaceae bacterium]|nr:hypothetical protein [Acidimicrobiaceae bacterium]